MDQQGQDLAERFVGAKPSKILTIATTGLVIAIRSDEKIGGDDHAASLSSPMAIERAVHISY